MRWAWPWSRSGQSCAFCDRALPANRVVPGMPMGRRIAFDPVRGRLWVVCGYCGQWNIAALDAEERARAIEHLEQAFHAVTERSATADISTASLGWGVSLIRVGTGDWRRFAAWRHGKRLTNRRFIFVMGAVALTWVNMLPWVDAMWDSALGSAAGIAAIAAVIVWRMGFTAIAQVRNNEGRLVGITPMQERHARLERRGGGWALIVRHREGETTYTGAEAVRVLRKLLWRRNMNGASLEDISAAVEMIDRVGGTERAIAEWMKPGATDVKDWRIQKLPKQLALAFEIAVHEESERREVEGELAITRAEARLAESRALIAEQI